MYNIQNHTFDLGYATHGGAKMKFIWVIALLCLTPTVIAGNLEEIEELVNSHHFNQSWEEDVFDCADMASANWKFFKDHGYNPAIVVRSDPGPGDHCYVIIPVGDGRVVGLDTSIRMGANLTKNLGAIRTNFVFYRIFQNPGELSQSDRSIVEGRRGPYKIEGVICDNQEVAAR